ncbi:sulfotransferase [uncultured Roseobacter sp.]|uniref:sulfotransferase family protein n=1 Tax=uncultured Roseobacter sp. TaxID=114847 RepID=UPI002620C838|nr:sulfotransferase [uncultured Roseobacter sp.]
MAEADITARAFIVFGALRSGTTLLRLMLDGHPRITCPGEMDFLIDHLDATGGYDRAALQADRIFRAHEALYPDHPLSEPGPQDFVARVAGPEDGMAAVILHRHLDRALEVFPGMRVVHLMRDPRDVARSSIGMGWAGNTYYGVDHWIGTQRDWQRALPQLPDAQRLVIRYEDLIVSPEETLGAICSFVGLDFHPDMLAYDADSSYSKPDPRLITQWKRKQSPRDVGLVEAKIGPLLQDSGYAPSGHPQAPPSAVERARLWLNNKRVVWAWRFRRHGLVDPLLVKLAPRIGLSHLGRSARQRMDANRIRHLK